VGLKFSGVKLACIRTAGDWEQRREASSREDEAFTLKRERSSSEWEASSFAMERSFIVWEAFSLAGERSSHVWEASSRLREPSSSVREASSFAREQSSRLWEASSRAWEQSSLVREQAVFAGFLPEIEDLASRLPIFWSRASTLGIPPQKPPERYARILAGTALRGLVP
jgi:hypothetical protein